MSPHRGRENGPFSRVISNLLQRTAREAKLRLRVANARVGLAAVSVLLAVTALLFYSSTSASSIRRLFGPASALELSPTAKLLAPPKVSSSKGMTSQSTQAAEPILGLTYRLEN